MIARVADHCFWLGRYIERTESTARVLQVTGTLALDAELAPQRCWHPVVIVSGQEPDFVARFGRDALSDADVIERYLARDDDNPVSLWRSVAAARENARAIREVISLEVWEVVNELQVFLGSDAADEAFTRDRHALYAQVQRSTQLGLGLLRSTMLHDDPLDFIWLGVLLERVGQTARLLDVQYHAMRGAPHPVLETALWLSLLRACSGYEPFMKRNRGRVDGARVASFLLLEQRFPRSIAYCVRAARERLASIVTRDAPGRSALDRLSALDTHLNAAVAEELESAPQAAGHQPSEQQAVRGPPRSRVHELLTHVVDEVHAVCDGIAGEVLGQGASSRSLQIQSQ